MHLFYKKSLLCIVVFFVAAQIFPAAASAKLSLKAGICVTRAQALYDQGRIKEAIQILDTCLQKFEAEKNKSEACHYLPFVMGNYYAQDGDHENAIQCYRKSLSAKPDFAQCRLNLARCAYEIEDYQTAAASFEFAYEHAEEKKAVFLYYAAVCRFQNKESHKALALFEQLLKKHPQAVTLEKKEILVNILFSLERYEAALPFLKELAFNSPAPKNKKWQEILLYQYLNLEMDETALALAKDLTRTDPLEPKWWKGLSHVHLKLDHGKKGLAALLVYGFLIPLSSEETKLAADLYLSLEVPEQAAVFYQALHQKDPGSENLERIVQALAFAHETDQALAWIDNGLKALGTDVSPSLLLLKARLLYAKKSWKAAAAGYEAAARAWGVENVPEKQGGAWLMKGHACLNAQDYDTALKAFEKAVKFKRHKKAATVGMKAAKRMQQYMKMARQEDFQPDTAEISEQAHKPGIDFL